jgi:hypothetical protein
MTEEHFGNENGQARVRRLTPMGRGGVPSELGWGTDLSSQRREQLYDGDRVASGRWLDGGLATSA